MKSTTLSFAALLLALVLSAPTTSAQDDAAELQVQTAQEDLVATLANRGDFTILVDALRSTGLDAALASGDTFTLFAPTDAAFERQDAAALDAAPSVQGSDLTFATSDAGLTVNGAAITEADLYASNGVIHVIDTVLMPEADASMEEDMMDDEMHEEHMDEEHMEMEDEKMMDDGSADAEQITPTDDQR
jgi:uncharacterized surface protein with fasciclin (FAS1) repeats